MKAELEILKARRKALEKRRKVLDAKLKSLEEGLKKLDRTKEVDQVQEELLQLRSDYEVLTEALESGKLKGDKGEPGEPKDVKKEIKGLKRKDFEEIKGLMDLLDKKLGFVYAFAAEQSGSLTETDPIWTSQKGNYYTKTEVDGKGYLTVETDPVWNSEKGNYYTSAQVDGKGYLTTETDPIYSADKPDIALKSELHSPVSVQDTDSIDLTVNSQVVQADLKTAYTDGLYIKTDQTTPQEITNYKEMELFRYNFMWR